MRYLIAIPCMDMVHTLFMSSLLAMRRPEGAEVGICSSSLIYDSRNTLAAKAVNEGFDRVLWLDSDMVFEPDLMEKLIADMDAGREAVTALYFTRKAPVIPCVYRSTITLSGGRTQTEAYTDYPANAVFEVAGCGMGAMMVSVDSLKATVEGDGRPFSPLPGWGEDLSFDIRLRKAGIRIWCDSRIKCGHLGLSLINETTWKGE